MKQIIVLAIMIPLILGCEKNSIEITDNSTPFIIAGSVTDKDTLINLTSKVELYNWCGFDSYTVIDSIDILDNGQYDIAFKNKRYGTNFQTELCPQDYSIHLLSDIQIGYNEKEGNALLPIYLSDTINQDLNWTTNNVEILWDSNLLNGGDWFTPPEAYLPFRYFDNNDTLYGWVGLIKLVKIEKYAINKGYH